MNRQLSSGVRLSLALIAILSCSDKSVTGSDRINTDDINADAARIATVTVSLGSSSIAVGDTTTATAALKDYQGHTLDRSVTWTSSNPGVATVSATGLVTGVAAGTALITASRSYKTGSATIIVTATGATTPGTVGDLAVAATDSTGVALTFTQVDDGTGQPAHYDVRYAVSPISWGAAASTTSGSCTTPVSGTAIGSKLTCTVLGLKAATNYSFQMVSFRGTLNQNAVFGALSNIVSATTLTSGSPPPAAVASVSVSPTSPSLQVGGTIQLAAITRDANNNILTGRLITWVSTNTNVATVSSTGFVTAVAAGNATITAASEGKTGTANVTVTAQGANVVFGDDFESGSMSKWSESNSAVQQVIRDAASAHSGSYFLRLTYGIGGGDAGWLNKYFYQGYTQLYVRYYVRFSTNFTGDTKLVGFHGAPIGNPQFGMGRAGICPNGHDSFAGLVVTTFGEGETFPTKMYTYWQDMWADSNGQCWGRYGPTPSTFPYTAPMPEFSKGVWHKVEYAIKMNSSANVADGEEKFWVDGVKYGEWRGIRFGDPSLINIGVLLISGSGTTTQIQTLDYDDLILTTDYPAQSLP